MKKIGVLITSLIMLVAANDIMGQTKGSSSELLEKGKKEGKVVWYAAGSTSWYEPLVQGFTKKTGIKVDVMRSGSERIYQRVTQELSAGIKAVDIIETGDLSHFIEWKQKGILISYFIEGADKYAMEFKDREGYYYTIFGDIISMGYNPTLVKAENVPMKYTDLLNPKWKGKLVQVHPGYSGQGLQHVMCILKLYGWDFYQKMEGNNPMIVQSTGDVPTPVISGERPMAASFATSRFVEAKRKGSPLMVIYPEEGSTFVADVVGILKDAPHPNAAKLFLEYVLSQEGQNFGLNFGYTSARSDMQNPSGRTPLNRIKLNTVDPASLMKERESVKEKFRQIFGV